MNLRFIKRLLLDYCYQIGKKKYNDHKVFRLGSILFFIVILELLIKFILIYKHQINWDEFYFVSQVFSYKRGELNQPFQNFHVHLFGWVTSVFGNEVTQIIAARYALFLLFITSGILLYLIAKHFIDDTGALFAVFCWISFSNIIRHGSSLRYDSFCSFFFLLACFCLLKKSTSRLWPMFAGISMGISLLISLKAAIHIIALFALLGALGVISSKKNMFLRKTIFFSAFLIITFSLGFSVHQKTLSSSAVVAVQQNFIHHAASKTIIFDKFFPRWGYFAETLRDNTVIWMLLGIGIFYTFIESNNNQKKKGLIALTFLVPLLSIPFYRNAFPYYYSFVITPAVMFCGILPQRIIQDFQKTGSKPLLFIFAFICLQIVGSAGFHFFKAFNQDNGGQKELLRVIHKVFPEPVPYIDRCSAVASYPNVAFFMSTWGFENYLETGQPIFRQILQDKHPQFLLANNPQLQLDLPRDSPFFKNNYDFFSEDRKTLEENFIRYWGMLWVPGKTLYFDVLGEQKTFEILIPGPYVIESDDQVILDQRMRFPGEKVTLENGKHTVTSTRNKQKIVFRWGKLSFKPQHLPSTKSMFYGF